MKIKSAKFITSVASSKNLISDDKIEIAFAGKSNVGKSSFINMLCGQKKLAKTSSLPGRTRLVNYFLINDDFYFVDLPGYGYAKAGQANKEMWATLLEDYLIKANKIKLVFMLVDIRHDATELDKLMLKFLYSRGIPFKIIATKADKIAKTKISSFVQNVAKCLGVGKDDIIAVSNETGFGVEKVLQEIEKVKLFDEEMELVKFAETKDGEIIAKLLSRELVAIIKDISEGKQIDKTHKTKQLIDLGVISEQCELTQLGKIVLDYIN